MHSLHEIDEKLLKYLNYKDGFFIECGANDGITQSNTLLLEQKLNWRGLLIEAGTTNYLKCKTNRPKCIHENYALVNSNYKDSTVKGNFDNPSHNGLMNSINDIPEYFDEEMIFWHNKFKSENISNAVSINCCTLQYLLNKHNIQTVDFFSLDVEGYEIEVLNGLDFDRVRPKFILMETTSLEYYRCFTEEYMKSKNYKLIDRLSINDALYMDYDNII
jgi:FkbM family methyltransferase